MAVSDVANKVTRCTEHEPIELAAFMLSTAINNFANRVAKEFPPGTPVRFRFLPKCPTEPGMPSEIVATGVMSKHQVVPAELSQMGILVEVDPQIMEQVPEWRLYNHGGPLLIQVGFYEIVKEEPKL